MINKCVKFSFISAVIFFAQLNESWSAPQTDPNCKGLGFNVQTALINLNTAAIQTLPLTVNRDDKSNGTCNFFIVMDYGVAISANTRKITHGADAIPIQLYVNSGRTVILESIAQATSSNVIMGSFTGKSFSFPTAYYVEMSSSPSAPPGPYLDGFKISLYEGTPLSHLINASSNNNVNFKFTKGNYVDISLVDSGAPFVLSDTTQTLDFGNLTTGETLGCDIVLSYNAGYELTMSSANSGRIKNIASADFINYTMSLNGTPITLSTLPEKKNESSVLESPAGGTRVPLSVTIGNVTGVKSGSYSDVVSISVASKY